MGQVLFSLPSLPFLCVGVFLFLFPPPLRLNRLVSTILNSTVSENNVDLLCNLSLSLPFFFSVFFGVCTPFLFFLYPSQTTGLQKCGKTEAAMWVLVDYNVLFSSFLPSPPPLPYTSPYFSLSPLPDRLLSLHKEMHRAYNVSTATTAAMPPPFLFLPFFPFLFFFPSF